MQTYASTLNQILKTDRILTETDEKMETLRGNIVTIWERLSANRFKKLESNRITSN